MHAKNRLVAVLAAVAALTHPWAAAHDAGNRAEGEEVVPMQRQALPDVPGKQVVMVTVRYAPGQASAPHRHPGSVFAYVLEGEVVSQVKGGPPVTYKAGQSWYEPPNAPHLVSRNASATRPAKILAWLLIDEGAQPTQPLPK